MSEHFTESELARAEGVLSIAANEIEGILLKTELDAWLSVTVQQIAEALTMDWPEGGNDG